MNSTTILSGARGEHRPSQVAWWIVTLAAMGVGVVSLRYLLPHVPFPGVPGNWAIHRGWVIVHATFASLAILAGPWQFLKLKSGARRSRHRWLGRFYLLCVLIGWLSSIPIALNAQGGRVAQAGFLGLGIVWISTTALAYVTIRRRLVEEHRRWMIRSYSLTCAAISLRIMIPLAGLAGYDFDVSYPAIAWACWLVNLLLVEVWIRRVRPARMRSAPAV